MPCGACGCCCNNAGGEVAGEQLLGASETTTTAEKAPVDEIVYMAVIRITKFIVRGLLILLWVYLYNSMRKYAINYIGEDTWFSTFVVIAIAVPVAEVFCIMGHILTTPIPPPRSSESRPRSHDEDRASC